MDFLIEPFAYSFMIRGLLGGLLTATACAALSAFVVWRGMSFMGDALAHSILPGIVAAYVLGINLFWGAMGAAVLGGAMGAAVLVVGGIGAISGKGRLTEDTAIGVVFGGFFALGILLLSRVATFSDLSHILFGNILGISRSDLILMSAVTVVVLSAGRYSGLQGNCYRFIRSRSRLGHWSFTAACTLHCADSSGPHHRCGHSERWGGYGSGPSGPGAAASLLSRKLERIIPISVLLAAAATLTGFYTSYYLNTASGPAIVLALTAEFLLCALAGKLLRKKQPGQLKAHKSECHII